MAIYAISDLHGQYGIFEKLLEVIDFSDDDYMYVLGDAIDRGPDGIRILQRIMSSPNMDLLIGNHEFLMLNFCGSGPFQETMLTYGLPIIIR